MEKLLSNEDSYEERRQLFKDIWETAMMIEDKNNDVDKPKVIKTLRLESTERCATRKRERQKLKNLRTVCRKILDFCDRQDYDELSNEKVGTIRKNRTRSKKCKLKKNEKDSNTTSANEPFAAEFTNFRITTRISKKKTSPIKLNKIKRKKCALSPRKLSTGEENSVPKIIQDNIDNNVNTGRPCNNINDTTQKGFEFLKKRTPLNTQRNKINVHKVII